MNIRPTELLVKILALAFLLGFVLLFYPELKIWLTYLCVFLSVVVAGDFIASIQRPQCTLTRNASHTVPLGVATAVQLSVRNCGARDLKLEVFDHYPSTHRLEGLPIKVDLM